MLYQESCFLSSCRLLELEEEYNDGDITEKVSCELIILKGQLIYAKTQTIDRSCRLSGSSQKELRKGACRQRLFIAQNLPKRNVILTQEGISDRKLSIEDQDDLCTRNIVILNQLKCTCLCSHLIRFSPQTGLCKKKVQISKTPSGKVSAGKVSVF